MGVYIKSALIAAALKVTTSAVIDVEPLRECRRFKVYEDEFTPPPKRPGPYQAPGRTRHKKGKR